MSAYYCTIYFSRVKFMYISCVLFPLHFTVMLNYVSAQGREEEVVRWLERSESD